MLLPPEELLELESPFSRGLSHGWLAGRNLQIVDGRNSANRGILVGKVAAVRGDRVAVELVAPLRRGDGIAFPSVLGEAHDQGGRVYEIFARNQAAKEAGAGQVELAFGRGAVELDRLRPGQEIWKTDDPQIDRRLRQSFARGSAKRRVPLDVTVEAAVGSKLRVIARSGTSAECKAESEKPLEEAQRHPLTAEVLREQFGRLGASIYELRNLDARIEGRPMAPLSVLGQLRHEMVRLLDAAAVARPEPRLLPRPECRVGQDRAASAGPPNVKIGGPALASSLVPPYNLHVLCREWRHVEEVLNLGVTSIIGDFAELQYCGLAVRMARKRARRSSWPRRASRSRARRRISKKSPTPSPTACWSATSAA